MSSDPETPFPDVVLFRGDPDRPRRTGVGGAVRITRRGCALDLLFDEHAGDARLVELRIKPAVGGGLDASAARRLVPQLDDYLALARAALDWRVDDARAAAERLRQVGRPGRGLSDDFFRMVASTFRAMVAEGERYPVNAIAERYNGSQSAASRWVTEARRRGYLPPREARD